MPPSEIIKKLLTSRGFTTQKSISEFLNPRHPDGIKWPDLNILSTDIQKVKNIIQKHIQNNHIIAIYGDYDVDGLCSTAILWQTIYQNYKLVFPHIPDRRIEGYGLSIAGIDHCISQGAKLIITVDSGIVAYDQIAYAKKQGLDVVVIDHHEKSDVLPPADAFIHSIVTCAAGLSYFLAREINEKVENLDLVCLAVVCDLVPLTGLNRSLAKFGLETLNHTVRPGLLALYEIAGIKNISAYHVGFIIGPRLNATGRLTHAMDSLRLLCTTNPNRATDLAKTLNDINIRRQQLTETQTQHALSQITPNSLIVVADKSYDEGVIGLIAAKLVEKYFRPAIVISVGETVSKASARSISGFHITEYLRKFETLFSSVGGHAMAAGFSFPSSKLSEVITQLAKSEVPKELLIKKDRFDLELPLEYVSWDLYLGISDMQPFGLGNSTPVFLAKDIQIMDPKIIGKSGTHLKFIAFQNGISFPCVWFNPPILKLPTSANYYYQIDSDTYRGPGNLQLITKNISGL